MSYCPTFHTSDSFLLSAVETQAERLYLRDEPVSVPGGDDDPKPQLGPDQGPDPANESQKPDLSKQDKKRTE